MMMSSGGEEGGEEEVGGTTTSPQASLPTSSTDLPAEATGATAEAAPTATDDTVAEIAGGLPLASSLASAGVTTTTNGRDVSGGDGAGEGGGEDGLSAATAQSSAPAPAPAPAPVPAPVPEKKKYAYRPPRLGDSFQATVPGFRKEMSRPKGSSSRTSAGDAVAAGNKKSSSSSLGGTRGKASAGKTKDLRPNQLSLRDGLVWDPNALPTDEVDKYLVFSRGLLEQTSHSRDRHIPRWRRPGISSTGLPIPEAEAAASAAKPELIPLEADEQALLYLYQQKYNVDMASLRLTSELGVGKEHKFLHALDTLYQTGASAASLDRRDRTSLVGSYYAGSTRGGRPSQFPYPYSYPGAAAAAAAVAAAAASAKPSAMGEEEEGVFDDREVQYDDEEEPMIDSREKKKRSSDKTETRRLYQILVERAGTLWRTLEATRKKCSGSSSGGNLGGSGSNSNNNISGGAGAGAGVEASTAPALTAITDRPSQAEISALLKDISGIPNLEVAPGEPSVKDMEKYASGLKEALASSRQFVAKVHDALNTTAGRPSPLPDLKDLLLELQQQPILLREEDQLSCIIAGAEEWQASAEQLVADLEKASLLQAQDLIAAADAIPVYFELRAFLQDKVDSCLALGEEIRAAIPLRAPRTMTECLTVESLRDLLSRAEALRLQFQEVQLVEAVIERAERWLAEAKVAVSETPDLKKLQSLLEEANGIPVDLSETCDEIRVKVEQAHQWVEKVRKALPRKNKTRSNAAADVGKVDYSAARTLLSEGAGIRVDVKELDDIAGVLDTAETWLQRVREALEESTDEAGLQSLQALLFEADDIPVEMDEHKILAAEIEARRWGLRVQPRLDGAKVTVQVLEGLVTEATALRQRLPIAAKDQKAWRLPQEVEARRRLEKSQRWLRDYRKCVNPNSLGFKKGVTVRKVLHLLKRAEMVPVDLSEFVRPLEEAVAKAEKWLQAALPVLQSCGIKRRTHFNLAEILVRASPAKMDVVGAEGGEEEKKEGAAGEDRRGRGEAEEGEGAEEEEEEEEEESDEEGSTGEDTTLPSGPKIEQEALIECVGEASDIGVELYEAERLKALLQRVQAWLDQLGVVCPKRTSKRRGARLKVTVAEVHELVEEGKAFPVDLSEEVEEITERLEATLKWQVDVQGELLEIAQEGLQESRAYKVKKVKSKESKEAKALTDSPAKEERGPGRSSGQEGEEAASPGAPAVDVVPKEKEEGGKKDKEEEEEAEEEPAGNFNEESYEKRLKRLEALTEQTTDVGIESAEDDMILRHLAAHKWTANAIDLLEFVDPDATITDIYMAEIEDVVKEGEKVLYVEKIDAEHVTEAASAAGAQEGGPASLAASPSADITVTTNNNDKTGGSPSPSTTSQAGDGGSAGASASANASASASASGSPSEPQQDGTSAATAPEDEEEGEGGGGVGAAVAMEVDAASTSSVKKEFEIYVTEQGEVKKRRIKQNIKKKKVLIDSHGQCDEVIQEMILFWWNRIGRLRDIWETSREWAKRASRLLSPGGEKVKAEVMEALLAETASWDFDMELVNRVRGEVERGKSILARATTTLEGEDTDKLELQALKSLITEGDKCKVLVEEIKTLRKHLAAGQRWLGRFQKARAEELDEMLALAEEAKEIRMDMGEDMKTVMHRITRCCFCRQCVDGPVVRCQECGEKYHQRCLDVGEGDAADWERRGWCCPRCLVRWHMRDALAKTMVIVSKWIASPDAAPLAPLPPHQGAHGGLYGAMHLDDAYARSLEVTTGKVKAWMKRLLHAVLVCAERNAEEVRTLGTSKLVKSSVLVEVIRLAKADLDVDKCADVKEVIWNLSVVFWGARLVCQLRRRPSLVPLQALTAEMQSVGIHNEPLQVMLNSLIARAGEWIYKTKPILREGWLSRDESPMDVERLKELLKEKRNVPVRLRLERRVEAMLSEEDPSKRYCHCRGFYDGFFMVQCISCNEWFHGKCVQIRAEDLDKKTEYKCVACCEIQKVAYPYPPYRPPDPEQALAEVDEEEEEAAAEAGLNGGGGAGSVGAGVAAGALGPQGEQDEETFMADKGSLEGIFPCKKKLGSLDQASSHVDMNLLPLPASFKRKKSGGADGRSISGASADGTSMTKKRQKASGAAGAAGSGKPKAPRKRPAGGGGCKQVPGGGAMAAAAAAAGLMQGVGGSSAGAAVTMPGYSLSYQAAAADTAAMAAYQDMGGGGGGGGGDNKRRRKPAPKIKQPAAGGL